jgi:hypothetical protein
MRAHCICPKRLRRSRGWPRERTVQLEYTVGFNVRQVKQPNREFSKCVRRACTIDDHKSERRTFDEHRAQGSNVVTGSAAWLAGAFSPPRPGAISRQIHPKSPIVRSSTTGRWRVKAEWGRNWWPCSAEIRVIKEHQRDAPARWKYGGVQAAGRVGSVQTLHHEAAIEQQFTSSS